MLRYMFSQFDSSNHNKFRAIGGAIWIGRPTASDHLGRESLSVTNVDRTALSIEAV